jgi:purine-binding chemotaxis protein CheW
MPVATDVTGTKKAQEELQLLIFSLHGEEFAVNLTDAREIIRAMSFTEVPGAPTSVRGILNLRGRVVTIVDVGTLLGFPAGDESMAHVIIAEQGKEMIGALVHAVTGVLRIPSSLLKPTPAFFESKTKSAHVRGALVLEQKTEKKAEAEVTPSAEAQANSRVILVLDLPALLAQTFIINKLTIDN